MDVHILESAALKKPRRLTVLLPRFRGPHAMAGRVAALYLNDGQNLFEQTRAFAGHTWRAAETVNWLVREGLIAPLLVVGIDHGDAERGREFLPVEDDRNPQTGRPILHQYMDFVTGEVVPFIERMYPVIRRPYARAFGGSSYGAIAALSTAIERPGVFGRLLLESPSLYVGNRLILRRARRAASWPTRVYVGVGTSETDRGDTNRETVENVRTLEGILREAGLGPKRLKVIVKQDATHSEDAWAARLPEALTFLFGRGG